MLLAGGALLGWGCRGALVESGADAAVEAGSHVDAAIQGEDAGAELDATAPPCSVVVATSYDQSCAVDTDCTEVGEVTSCPAGPCDTCTTSAVNVDAAAAYAVAFGQAIASAGPNPFCGCPCEGYAICRGGKCEEGHCGPAMGDTLPACADAGGRCAYARGTTCTLGPADGCAYADEICCLN